MRRQHSIFAAQFRQFRDCVWLVRVVYKSARREFCVCLNVDDKSAGQRVRRVFDDSAVTLLAAEDALET
jgi:hypothetical protein